MEKSTLVAFSVVFAFTLIVEVFGEQKSCKESVSELTKRQLKRVGECTKKNEFRNGKEKNERKVCVMRCVFEAEGALGADGLPDPIGTLSFVEIWIPSTNIEKARSIIMSCLKTTAHLDPAEVSCKSYDPMVKCAMNGVGQLCS